MLLSTLTSSTLAAVGTLGLVLAGRNSDVIRNMREVAPEVPGALVDALYLALPNFRNFDFKMQAAHGEAVPLAALAWVTVYAAVYLCATLVAGLAAFGRRDLQ
jgi:hypothetical protein